MTGNPLLGRTPRCASTYQATSSRSKGPGRADPKNVTPTGGTGEVRATPRALLPPPNTDTKGRWPEGPEGALLLPASEPTPPSRLRRTPPSEGEMSNPLVVPPSAITVAYTFRKEEEGANGWVLYVGRLARQAG